MEHKVLDIKEKEKSGYVLGKSCKKCGKDYWYKVRWTNGKDGYRCGPCSSRFRKKWKQKNKDKYRNWSWKDRGIDMTVERYEQMLENQQHRCYICGIEGEKLFVDHCHETGKTRALLCHKCNVKVVDRLTIERIFNYIKEFQG